MAVDENADLEFTTCFIASVPVARALGMTAAGPGVSIRLPAEGASRGSNGGLDTGALIVLVDQTFGAAVLRNDPGMATSTIDLRIDWLAGTDSMRDAVATAVVDWSQPGRALLAARVVDPASGRLVAKAAANFILNARPGGEDGQRDWSEADIAGPWQSFEQLLGARRNGQAFLIPAAPHLVGVRAVPAVHGGIIGASLKRAALDRATAWSEGAYPLSASVRYLRPAIATEDLHVESDLERQGRRAAFIRSEARQGDGRLIARGEFTFLNDDL